MARANQIHSYIQGDGVKALLICQGPDAYVSPDWLGLPDQVPTWTYTAVHVTGSVMLLPQSENLAHINRLSDEIERRLSPKKSWSSKTVDPSRRSVLLKAVVSMSIKVETIEAQKKLIQHKGETEHRSVIEALSAHDDTGAQTIAAMMQESAELKFTN